MKLINYLVSANQNKQKRYSQHCNIITLLIINIQ